MKRTSKPEDRPTLTLWGLVTLSVVLLALHLLNPRTMNAENSTPENKPAKPAKTPTGQSALATFGGGCFWCTEAVFERVEGVSSVVSGYSGGELPNPTYKQICTGETGHAEVIQIAYDPGLVTFEQLLSVFWQAHDPTTLNRQGNDVGTQYRSVIFYHDDAQKAAAEKSKLEAAGMFKRPIVTEISPFTKFYKAEDYHQDYFANNPSNPYCNYFIPPKLNKLQKSGLIK